MLDATLRWLAGAVERYGIRALLVAPVGVIGFLGALGLLPDSSSRRLATVVLLLAVVLTTLVSMSLLLHRSRAEVDRLRRLLQRNSNLLIQAGPADWRITRWKEAYTISANGDVTMVRCLSLEVTEGVMVACRQWFFPTTGGPLSEAEKRKVRVEARGLDAQHLPTTRYDYIEDWERWDGCDKHQLQVHFHEPVHAGAGRGIYLKWVWPGHSKALVRGGHEDFTWRIGQEVDEVETSVHFETSAGIGSLTLSPLGESAAYGAAEAEVTPNEDGSRTVRATYRNLPPGTLVGFRLDTDN